MKDWDLKERVMNYVTSGKLIKNTLNFYSKSVWIEEDGKPIVIATKTPLGFSIWSKILDDDLEIYDTVDFVVAYESKKFKKIGANVLVSYRGELGVAAIGIFPDYPDICSFKDEESS